RRTGHADRCGRGRGGLPAGLVILRRPRGRLDDAVELRDPPPCGDRGRHLPPRRGHRTPRVRTRASGSPWTCTTPTPVAATSTAHSGAPPTRLSAPGPRPCRSAPAEAAAS